MGKKIGIDLGTTYSAMAFVDIDREVKIIKSAEGYSTTPSVVAWKKNGELLVGVTAKNQAVTNSKSTVKSIKRQMGNAYKKKIRMEEYTPEEISAKILMKLKTDAEKYFGEEVTDAVVTVPAYFRDGERKATMDAAKIAGLNVRTIINEPDAAAIAFGLDRKLKEGKILVFDLGGGTFDVTVLNVVDGNFSVVTTDGERLLGGNDFDGKIITYIVEKFKRENDIDLRGNQEAVQLLTEYAEKAKNELSFTKSTDINIPFIVPDRALNIDMELTREKFNELTKDLVGKTKEITEQMLEKKGIKKEEIDKIVMVGGCSRIPAVQDAVKDLFGGKEPIIHEPDEAIAKGAAIQAALTTEPITPEEERVRDKLLDELGITTMSASHAMGIDAIVGGVPGVFSVIIEKDTNLPAMGYSERYHTSIDYQTSMDIDVYEGKNKIAKENHHWGTLLVPDIPPKPKGVEIAEITFDYDENNRLHVVAEVLSTGKIVETDLIGASHRLSASEIEEMAIKAQKDFEEKK